MGYESKLYFKDRNNTDIATIDLCKMGYEFPKGDFYELFNKEYEYGLYVDMACTPLSDEDKKYYPNYEYVPDIRVHEDSYGAKLKYCYAEDLYEWCKKNRKEMDYRRVDLLYKMTKELSKRDKWGEVKVVFFGY